MIEDKSIEALIKRIEFEIDVTNTMIDGGVEEKFKYLLIGKINGMLEALRIVR